MAAPSLTRLNSLTHLLILNFFSNICGLYFLKCGKVTEFIPNMQAIEEKKS